MKTIVLNFAVLSLFILPLGQVNAQVSPDGTLSTIVNPVTVSQFQIDGGLRSGNNLFHSFSQFSVPTGGSAIFNNATDVQNIFSRVTGSQLSNIDGILKNQGSANLFLMNPNGIVFGPNAQLQLGGSFLGTTANGIKFADGIEFNTVNETPALLSVKVPIGLQMGQNSGSIVIQGSGHNLLRSSIFSPAPPNTNPINLSVNLGQSLVLVGNTVNLEGGSLKAPSGTIDIASLSAGEVGLEATALGWKLNHSPTTQWSNIALSNASLIDASGSPGGTIQLAGRDITLQDSSTVLIQNQGIQNADRISIRAAGTLAIQGLLPNLDQGLIGSETVGPGRGADIIISANKMKFSEGGTVLSASFLAGGQGGDISVNATDSIEAIGFFPNDPSRTSGIVSSTLFGGGQGGHLSVTTQKLNIYDGGGIANLVFGGIDGGNMDIKADTINLIGENPITSSGSVLTATSFFGGDAGKLRIDARRILLQNGGVISSSTLNTGTAGSLTINASESVQVLGRGRFGQESRIAASAETLSLIFQQVFGLPAMPTGNSGNLDIYSPVIQVKDGATIKVDNAGKGTAGKLSVFANVVQLDRSSAITASTLSGEGGDIKLTVQEYMSLRRDSKINAAAAGLGNGGNIRITSPIIIGLENSDIIASAIKGQGGNIRITTQSLFGLKYRDRPTLDNDITASSEFGINGSVQVNTIGINPANTLNELPHEITDSSRQISDRCGTAKTSSFIATGRGGVPQDPIKNNHTNRTWHDVRTNSLQTSSIVIPIATQPIEPLVEASGIEVDTTGAIALVSAKSIASQLGATCGLWAGE
jgi:filamentous hemagglutinin family protein